MLREITLGQYYPSGSAIHGIDPRVKIIATIVYMVALFIADDAKGLVLCALVLAVVVWASKVPLKFILRGMRPILFILIFTFCLNIFMLDGKILWSYGFLHITDNGIYTALFMAARLFMIIIGASLLTLTTTPISLTDGMEKILSPLSKVGVHTHEVAMMTSIALRFIPTLMKETDKIISAQQARGADFESGNIFARAKALVPIIIPLFVSAFRIAQDLALAMEARCYHGGKGRTRMNGMTMRRADWLWVCGIVVFMVAVILVRVML